MKMVPSVITFLVLCALSINVSLAGKSGILGSWKVNASNVPVEFAKSTMVVTGSENAPSVRIIFKNGSVINASNVSFKGNDLRFSVFVEGTVVPFTGKVSGDKITGTVSTPEGAAGIEAERLTLTGSWTYRAPNAPWEYSNGKIVFGESNGKPTARIIVGGAEVPASSVAVTNGTSFSFSVPIEFESVGVTGSIEGDKITGNASSSQGVISFSATWD